jgi:maleate cis-trans isomerase
MNAPAAERNVYAPRGLLGVLTPQANPTAEIEMALLLPPGMGTCTARLTSAKPAMAQRLIDYFDTLPATLAQFGGMRLDAACFACTGSSYLAGPAREDELLAAAATSFGFPALSSALSITNALRTLEAEDIAIVSPYDAALTEASVAYWQARGLRVRHVQAVAASGAGAGHPIYGLPPDAAQRALAAMPALQVGAVVLLGTGMPSLGAILESPQWRGAPVLSSMLALAWAGAGVCDAGQRDRTALRAWIAGTHWRAAHAARMATAP